jgi:alpha-glucosidase
MKYAIARYLANVRGMMQYRKKTIRRLKSSGLYKKIPTYVPIDKVRFDRQDVSTLYFLDQAGRSVMVSVLERDVVRVSAFSENIPRLDRTWIAAAKDGSVPPEGRDRADLSPFSLPSFVTEDLKDAVSVDTGIIRIVITLAPFSITFMDSGGASFAADLPAGAYSSSGDSRRIRHSMRKLPGSCYYGFGETSGRLEKSGRKVVLEPMDAMGYDARTRDPLYTAIPYYLAYEPASGTAYGVLYDNLSVTEFDIGKTDPAAVSCQADDGDLDYYLIFGPSPDEVAVKYSRLTGRPSLPPRYSLGYLASGMAYADSPEAQAQFARFIDCCKKFDVPCSLFHLCSGVTTGDDGKRYVFTWNRKRVPDPNRLAADFREAGMRLAANLKPVLSASHPEFESAKKQGLLIRESRTDSPLVAPFWGGPTSFLDFTNPLTRVWWKKNLKEKILSAGIEVSWNDGNEFEIGDENARCEGFGRRMAISQARPLQALLMVQASVEAQTEFAPGKRPFAVSRSACPGMQRYAQVWTGDNLVSWNSLKFGIPLGLGLSVSGIPNFGHDAGGFWGYRPSPELFIRWLQSCVLLPRFCINSWHIDKSVNEPWMFPKHLDLVRNIIRFRYRIAPYLYSLMFDSSLTGRPPVRPMFYRFPEDERCRLESFDFMIGSKLLVAPVFNKGERARSLYLPGEEKWVDFHTGDYFSPGQTVTVDAPLDRAPMLVQEGGIIPLAKEARSGKPDADDYREVRVFPHLLEGTGTFTFYEDDGESLDYQKGGYACVILTVRSFKDHIEVEARKDGDFPLPYREIVCVLPQGEKRPAVFSGSVKLSLAGH